MPIYEYKCEQGHIFEVMQRISDDPLASCQTCTAPVQRVFHPVAVHFKGSGFYNTDYGTRKRAKESGENGGKDEGAAKSEAKSEAKPEKKTEAKASTPAASSD
jgi:putative FmdB family regulatory protein